MLRHMRCERHARPTRSSLRVLAFGMLMLVPLAVLYVASDGPAWALTRRSRIGRDCYRIVYAPVNWTARQSPTLDAALTAHGHWWNRRLPN
jgi:hypothetical protein